MTHNLNCIPYQKRIRAKIVTPIEGYLTLFRNAGSGKRLWSTHQYHWEILLFGPLQRAHNA